MFKQLLFSFFLLFSQIVNSQAPAWEWAKEAFSSVDEQATDITFDSFSSHIYVTGWFEGNLSSVYGPPFASPQGRDGFVVKGDQQGNIIWAFRIGSTGDDEVRSIFPDGLGNIYVTGYFRGTVDFDPGAGISNLVAAGANRDGFLAKYSSTGSLIWAVKFGNLGSETGSSVFYHNNSVFITGSYESSATFYSTSSVTLTTAAAQSSTNFFGAKYNSSGIAQFVVSGGSSGADLGTGVVADTNGVYFLGMYFQNLTFYNGSAVPSGTLPIMSSGESDVFVLKTDQAGNILWHTNACTSDNDFAYGITQDQSNIFIAGSFEDNTLNLPFPSPLLTKVNTGDNDLFLASINKFSGVYQWVSSQTGTGTDDANCYDLERDAAGNLIVTGSFRSNWNFSSGGGPTISSSGNEDVFVAAFSATGAFLWATKAGAGNRDISWAVTCAPTGGIYIAGEHFNAAQFGEVVLTNAGGKNIFAAKTCDDIITNNIISASQTVCVNGLVAPLVGSLPSGAGGIYTYTWQQSANENTWTAAAGLNSLPAYSPPTASATVYYRRNVSAVSGCLYSSNVVTISTQSNQASAGSNQTVCALSTTITANAPLFGSGTWVALSGGATIANPLSPGTGINNLVVGVNTFAWIVTSTTCPTSSATISVYRDDFPTAAVAGTNQTICSQSLTLNGNQPTTGTGAWTVLQGSATVNNPNLNNSLISFLSAGSNLFEWKITNGVCAPSASTVTVVRDTTGTPAVVAVSQTICATSATLSGNTPLAGTGSWSVVSGGGSITAVTSPVTSVTQLAPGSNVFTWNIKNGVCPASTATLGIWRDDLPSVVSAGSNTSICSSTYNLNGGLPSIGTGSWSVLAGTGSINSSSFNNTGVSNLSVGSNIFEWRISNGVCTSVSSTVELIRDANPSLVSAGSNTSICSSTYNLNGGLPSIGTGSWSVLAGTGSITSR